jgi:hypothetical protein
MCQVEGHPIIAGMPSQFGTEGVPQDGEPSVSFTVRIHSLTRVSLVRKRFLLVFTLGIATPLRDRPQ